VLKQVELKEQSAMHAEETRATAIDPVCGMTVEVATASRTSEYQGKIYYFCAPGCRKTFDASPDQYLGTRGQELPMLSQGCACCQG
jgi:YHS domain-containing protein